MNTYDPHTTTSDESVAPGAAPHAGNPRQAREMDLPFDGATNGELTIAGGTTHVTIRATGSADTLCHAHFEGRLPEVYPYHGRVEIVYPRFWPAGWLRSALLPERQAADLTLSAKVPWAISVRGGASHLDADLRKVQVRGFEVRGGTSHTELDLGRPSGTVPLHLRGGTSNLTLRRPAGVPVRLIIRGGASRLEFDTMRFGAIGGPFDWQSPDYASATDRYELEIGGGASHVAILGE
jgi:hypothetical protein